MTLTEETTYLPSMHSSKGDIDPDNHWDINDNVLPMVRINMLDSLLNNRLQTHDFIQYNFTCNIKQLNNNWWLFRYITCLST